MSVDTRVMPLEAGTGSSSLDRLLSYDTVKRTAEYGEQLVAKSSVLSDYVAPVASKSLEVSVKLAAKVPGVKTVAAKVDEISDRTLQKIEDVALSSQEKLNQYVRDSLPLDRDSAEDGGDAQGLSVANVRERVVVNTSTTINRVVPESVVTVAGKSAHALSTAYNGITRDNIKQAYNNCTVENAKTMTKDTVKGAYHECTAENAKKVVHGTATATKAVVNGTYATTKAVVASTVAGTKFGYQAVKDVTAKTVEAAEKTKNFALGATVTLNGIEPETPETSD